MTYPEQYGMCHEYFATKQWCNGDSCKHKHATPEEYANMRVTRDAKRTNPCASVASSADAAVVVGQVVCSDTVTESTATALTQTHSIPYVPSRSILGNSRRIPPGTEPTGDRYLFD